MELKQFAEQFRLQVRRDVDGTDIVVGKFGHIYEHSVTKLSVLFMPPVPRARLWSIVKAKGTEAGMIVRQNGDSEGTLVFDPNAPEQARLAIRLVRARPKRILTEEQRSALSERLSKARKGALRNGTSAARTHEGVAA
jgi:predicted DNA-binding transcriptional regulator YafY